MADCRIRRSGWARRTLVLAAASALAVTPLAAFAASASAAGRALVNAAAGRCLDVAGGEAVRGAALQLQDCGNSRGQKWVLTADGGLSTFGGRFCVQPGTATTGARPAVLARCNGKPAQAFAWGPRRSLVAQKSGLCLDASGEGTTNGTPVILWACTKRDNQRWTRSAPSGGCPARGHVTYSLTRAANPTAAEQDAYTRITTAMDQALSVYNCYLDVTKTLSVTYVPSVPTADAAYNGAMRFGATSTMQQITAMHEVGHTLGVGTYSAWASHLSGGVWTGAEANALLRSITGDPTAAVHGDTQHFWPYGLNYTSEVTGPDDLVNHVRIVGALRHDMGLDG